MSARGLREAAAWRRQRHHQQPVSLDPNSGANGANGDNDNVDSDDQRQQSHNNSGAQELQPSASSRRRRDRAGEMSAPGEGAAPSKRNKWKTTTTSGGSSEIGRKESARSRREPLWAAGREHPLDAASLISKLSFGWMLPFLWCGWRHGLGRTDMPRAPSRAESYESIGQPLVAQWDKELTTKDAGLYEANGAQVRKHRPSLAKAVLRTHATWILMNSFIALFAEVGCKTLAAYSVGQMLAHIARAEVEGLRKVEQEGDGESGAPIGPLAQWTCALVAAISSWAMSAHFYGFQMMRVGLHVRLGCSHLIYRKALRLGQAESGQKTMGRMINLLSNDLDKFNYVFIMLPFLWLGPLQTIVSLYLLWPILGPTTLAVPLLLLFLTPLQLHLSSRFARLRRCIAAYTDERVCLLIETIQSLKLIKLYAWEPYFRRRLCEARARETKLINRVGIIKGLSSALMFVSSKLLLLATLLLHCLWFGRPLEPSTLFMAMAMLNNVNQTMSQLLPRVLSLGVDSLVSLRRISDFLQSKDFSPSLNMLHTSSEGEDKLEKSLVALVECKGVGAQWVDAERPTLLQISFTCRSPHLLIIGGQVASGKSSLLLALLDELPISQGRAFIQGSIAYASQRPWIFSGSLRDNILFGQAYEQERYKQVIRACALERDLELLAHGDRTYIQEDTLSGGQKARLNLARCLYRRASIYLLDDPFSAVDGRVGRHLLAEGVRKFLKGKLVILTTHQVTLFDAEDEILVLHEGRQLVCAKLGELRSKNLEEKEEALQKLTSEQLAAISLLVQQKENTNRLIDEEVESKAQALRGGEDEAVQVEQVDGICKATMAASVREQTRVRTRAEKRESGLAHAPYGPLAVSSAPPDEDKTLITVQEAAAEAVTSTSLGAVGVGSMAAAHKATDEKQEKANKVKNDNELVYRTSLRLPLAESEAARCSNSSSCNEDQAREPIGGPIEEVENSDKTSARSGCVRSWLAYYTQGSSIRLAAIVVTFLIAQTLFSTVDIYLTVWSLVEQNKALVGQIGSYNHQFEASRLEQLKTNSTSVAPHPSRLIIPYDIDHDSAKLIASSPLSWWPSAGNSGDDHVAGDRLAAPTSAGLYAGAQIDLIRADQQQPPPVKPIYRPLCLLVAQFTRPSHALTYTCLVIGLLLASSLANIVSFTSSNKSAIKLFQRLADSGLFAQIAFFDQQPPSRYLNRATRDIGIIDEAIPYNANQAYEALLNTVASLLIIGLVDLKLALPSLLVLILFTLFHRFHLCATKAIQRLEGAAKSPLLAHVAATLDGLHTIRSSGGEQRLELEFGRRQDEHTAIFLLLVGCNRSLAIILDGLNATYTALIATWVVVSGLGGPSAGLIITSAMLLAGLTQHGLMKLTETESLMTSVERVIEYCQLPQEEPQPRGATAKRKGDLKGDLPESTTKVKRWLINRPTVEYRQVDLFYDKRDNNKPVLKNITFKLGAGEKVAIVGRTGAGKSSIITTLFRLYDFDGLILIDGQDIKRISLSELRQAIGIIPQQPILFSASVRQNLDPGNHYDDAQLWSALHKAHLANTVSRLPGRLEATIGDAGGGGRASLSAGQKQLMCLARVLLRQCNLIVMDEATANVDPSTEAIIQSTIRSHFKRSTVITIAHRLATILDYDRIMVLEAGRIVDFDTPEQLAAKSNSYIGKQLRALKQQQPSSNNNEHN